MADIVQLKTNVRIRVDGDNLIHFERLEAGQWVSRSRLFSASSSSSSSSSFSSSSNSSSSSSSAAP